MSNNGRNAYSDQALISVINGTDTAISSMNQVSGQVGSVAAVMPMVNNSESGIKLRNAFTTWTSDFNRVVQMMTDLNYKAKDLLRVNRSTNTDASTTANGPSSGQH
ncbi:hypothetical protein [Actinokineospora bangkokensis]|uniref:WXG100 family type VII secretion target n=1 Tax=Actinokineospora bangkokensis TaxID=1193682 RepID=A0A1Q9LMV5_9PSEU|nr:hypothetical protein [Actinokineospora bangkokensis]OLR93345.1 hypothetical protein BJP25_17900 [Actinokineospora bangkokensis]